MKLKYEQISPKKTFCLEVGPLPQSLIYISHDHIFFFLKKKFTSFDEIHKIYIYF